MNLEGAELNGADLESADLEGTKLNGANLNGTNLGGANLRCANLEGAELGSANLNGADLEGADLTAADLSSADLEGAKLGSANLNGANLSGANLSGAKLGGADLSDADFSGANLEGAELSGANLNGAQLGGAELNGADFEGANLTNTILRFSRIESATAENSKWSNDFVRELRNRGATLSDDLTQKLAEDEVAEGLTLYFDTRLMPVDRALVEIAIKGLRTSCEIVEFRNDDDRAIIRLTAEKRDDLVTVADWLHNRQWEHVQNQKKRSERADGPANSTEVVAAKNLDKYILDIIHAAFATAIHDQLGPAFSVLVYKLGYSILRERNETTKVLEIIRKWDKVAESSMPALKSTFAILQQEQDKDFQKEVKETTARKIAKAVIPAVVKKAVGLIDPSDD